MTKKIMKAAREKQPIIYNKYSIRLSVDFSSETQQAKREQW